MTFPRDAAGVTAGPEPAMDGAPAPRATVTGVDVRYEGRVALEGVNLRVGTGELVALIGVNGAGKSTLLRLLAGLRRPDAGRVAVDGFDLQQQPAAARTRVGYLPDGAPAYDMLTVAENVIQALALRGIRAAPARAACARALERVDVTALARRRVGALSQGQRRRAALAVAIAHEPALLLLDEPASGLDPLQADALNALLRTLATERAVIFSTHALDAARHVADRLVLMHAGRVALDAPSAAWRAPGALEARLAALVFGAAA